MNKQVIKKLNEAKKEISLMITKVEQNESCIEIIMQSKKIQQTLHEADQILIRCYLKESIHKFVETNQSDSYLQDVMKGVRAL